MITGILADPTLSKQHEPKPLGFSFQERKLTNKKEKTAKKINESIIPRFQKLANIT